MSETTCAVYTDLTGDVGVLKTITSEGVGVDTPTDGCTVSVHYTCKSMNGDVFDSSLHCDVPFEFQLGRGSVIKAFDIGIATMKLGEKCVLICSPNYAFGEGGSGSIPPNASLVFELEMLGWQTEDVCPDVDTEIIQILAKSEKKRRKRIRVYVKREILHPYKWSKEATIFFLAACKKRKDRFCDPKTHKKGFWSDIMCEMNAAGFQIEDEDTLSRKMRKLKWCYKTIKDKKNRGRALSLWKFFDDLDEIFKNDPTCNCSPVLNAPGTPEFLPVSEESEVEENAGQGEHGFKWRRKATKFFLASYRKRKDRFRNPEIKKKRLWSEIQQEMHSAGFQVGSEKALALKMRNMKRTFKNLKDKKSEGRPGKKWKYFDAFKEIFDGDTDPVNCGPVSNTEQDQCNFAWSDEATKFFLAAYMKRKDRFRDPQIKRISVWADLSREMRVAGFQVKNAYALDSKLRNMKRRYKIIKGKKRGGRDRISWKYFDACEQIFESDLVPVNCGPVLNDTEEHMENFTTSTDTSEFVAVTGEGGLKENVGQDQRNFKWSEKATKLLVAAYKKRKEFFRDPKIKKKKLWSEILQEMNVDGFKFKNADELDVKMRNMKRIYKKIKEKKIRDRGQIGWKYFDALENIFETDADPINCAHVLNDTVTFKENLITYTDTPESVDIPEEIELVENCFVTSTDTPEFVAVTGEGEFKENVGQDQRNFKWSEKATKFLMAAYRKRKDLFRNPKIIKKKLWSEILQEMNVNGFKFKNADELDIKMRNMKRIYKRLKEKKIRDRCQIVWKYFDGLENIFETDADSINCGHVLNDTVTFKENFLTYTDTPESVNIPEEIEFVENCFVTSTDTPECVAVTGEGEFKENVGQDQRNFKWNEKATRFLMAAYGKRKDIFRDPRIKKKNLWSEILQEMNVDGFKFKNADELDIKMRNMKRIYKSLKEKKIRGRGQIVWKYFDALENIFETDADRINCGHVLNDTDTFEENLVTYTDTPESVDIPEETEFVENCIVTSTDTPEFLPVTGEGELKENVGQGQRDFKWSKKSTKLLLAAYRKRMDRFRDPNIKKKHLWAEILREMRAAGLQVENEDALDHKMSNMKCTYKILKDYGKDTASSKENLLLYTPEFVEVPEEFEENADFKWCEKATELLVTAYRKRQDRFRDPNIKKKHLWAEILREMRAAGFQVENEDALGSKMRNMKSRYRKIKEKKRGGRDGISWVYFDAFEEIFRSDHTINGGPVLSSIDISESVVSRASSPKRNPLAMTSLYTMRRQYLTIEERRVQALAETNRLLAERNDLVRELIQTQKATQSTPASDEAISSIML